MIKMIKRRFEFSIGSSNKFWETWRINNNIYVKFGRINSSGRELVKNLPSSEQAEKIMNRQIKSKLNKGYNEVYSRTSQPKTIFQTKTSKPKTKTNKKKSSDIPDFRIRPMLASQHEEYLDHPNYIAQQKYDGTRCIIIKKNNKISLIGRSWKSNYASNFPKIINDIKKINLNSFILDSELTFFKNGKDVFLTALASDSSKKDLIAKCMVFDILEYNGKIVRQLPLTKRLELLDNLLPKGLRYLKVVKSYRRNHKKIFENIISDKQQGEGVVLKHIDSKYMEAGRNKDWIKVKGWLSDEAIVVGATHGTGVRESSFGSLILVQYYNNKFKHVGNASGFKQSEQNMLIEKMKNIKTKIPQINGINPNKIKYWVKPKIVVEIKFQERTSSGKFRFPSFMRIRHDKTPKECILKI